MTKKDIIQRVAEEARIREVKAAKTVDTILEMIGKELMKGNDAKIRGFGKFSVTEIAERRCRHPKTGKLVRIPAHRRVKFTPGVNLKNTLNAGNTARKGKTDTAQKK